MAYSAEKLFELAKDKGITADGAKGWITKNDGVLVANDAALVTTPNSGIPIEFTSYIDSIVIEILTAKRNARKLFGERKVGDWTTSQERFRVEEYTGSTTAYDDYANNGVAGVNTNYPIRDQYRFQTTIKYGDLEQAINAQAKMNLASSKQRSAAIALDTDANKFYLYGVQGKSIYGLLNDPNLNAAITPTVAGTWAGKTTTQIFNDILQLWASLKGKSQGNITEEDDIVLAVSPQSSVYLAKATDYNVTVLDMLKRYFGDKLTIVELPELHNETAATDTAYLAARSVMGQPTAELVFGEKYKAFPVIREMSAFKQKVMATTFGAVIYMPFAIARMSGI